MARIDALLYGMKWSELARLTPAFWDECIDDTGELEPECQQWLFDINLKADLYNWKVALDAAEVYTDMRGDLSAGARASADLLCSQTFGIWSYNDWLGFEREEAPEKPLINAAEFQHSISPKLIDELLKLWQPALQIELEQLFPERPQNTYLFDSQAFIGYIEGWLSMLRNVRQRGEWGVLLALSY